MRIRGTMAMSEKMFCPDGCDPCEPGPNSPSNLCGNCDGGLKPVPAWTGSQGADRIAAERRRQVEEEHWRPEHDDYHNDGGLAMADHAPRT